MQLVLFLVEVKIDPPPHTFGAPCGPFVQQLAHAQHTRHPADQHIKIAREGIHQRGHFEQLVHQLVRVGPPLEVDRDFQSGQVGLIAHIGDFPYLTRLDKLRDLIDNLLDCRGIWDFCNFNQIVLFLIVPF